MACILLYYCVTISSESSFDRYHMKQKINGGIKMSEFKNQAIVITGGSGGMGLCIAESFLKEGAEVYLADINK